MPSVVFLLKLDFPVFSQMRTHYLAEGVCVTLGPQIGGFYLWVSPLNWGKKSHDTLKQGSHTETHPFEGLPKSGLVECTLKAPRGFGACAHALRARPTSALRLLKSMAAARLAADAATHSAVATACERGFRWQADTAPPPRPVASPSGGTPPQKKGY